MIYFTLQAFINLLCDVCHTKYERDPDIPIGEFCKPCRDRMDRFTLQGLEQAMMAAPFTDEEILEFTDDIEDQEPEEE